MLTVYLSLGWPLVSSTGWPAESVRGTASTSVLYFTSEPTPRTPPPTLTPTAYLSPAPSLLMLPCTSSECVTLLAKSFTPLTTLWAPLTIGLSVTQPGRLMPDLAWVVLWVMGSGTVSATGAAFGSDATNSSFGAAGAAGAVAF